MVVDYCLYDSDIVLIFFLQKLVNMFFKCFIHDFTEAGGSSNINLLSRCTI
jgi:hypothetical protein